MLLTLAWRPDALGHGETWPWVPLAAFTVLSATNDIVTDGYTIEKLAQGQYGIANGLRIGFYRVGMLAAGGLLVVAGWLGESNQPNWAAAYLTGAVLMLVNAALILARHRSSLPRFGLRWPMGNPSGSCCVSSRSGCWPWAW